MIRWCSYCQAFMGEKPPFDEPTFTHTMCSRCDRRLEQGEALDASTVPLRALMNRVLASARAGDETACADIVARARELGLRPDSVLVGLLQPALYQAGLDWQGGRMSVAAEHRLTSWCERAFNLLVTGSHPTPPIDLLILQTSGTEHTVGPRFAAASLASHGISVEVVVPALPLSEIKDLVRELRPRVIGFSCALPESVRVATDLVEQLRAEPDPVFHCRYLLSGFAFRMPGADCAAMVSPGIEIALTLDPGMFARPDASAA